MDQRERDLEACEEAKKLEPTDNVFNLPWVQFERVSFNPSTFQLETTWEGIDYIQRFSPSRVYSLLTKLDAALERERALRGKIKKYHNAMTQWLADASERKENLSIGSPGEERCSGQELAYAAALLRFTKLFNLKDGE